ncbi:MAG TPA: adenylate/guanylate cyclase domain-containing protein [Gaiellaceae bacterium]|nr:adenylate/guanylate cyclase domain-containing protein [Gaiellaceae bacterium]
MARCAHCGAELPAAARFCPSCGVRVEAPAATEERKLVSVLFADLVGSTAFAAGEDPERVRSVLDRFYDAMASEAAAAGGTVEKFAGDAVLAAFGAAEAHEDHAERALHAALAMQRRFAEIFGDRLALRVGVSTGEVAVGPARVGGSFLSGDVVNVAARLEQGASPGEILVSERTVAAVRGAFEFAEPRVLEAKGKEEGIPCRRLERSLALQRPRGIGVRRTAFVGRESEVELLRATYRRAASRGEPHLVSIVGEAGVGKSRLVRELWEVLAAEDPAPLRRTGRCLSYGDGITYWPVAEVVREHYGILESDAPSAVLGRLGEQRTLGLALGLDLADSHPLETRERLQAAVVELFAGLAAGGPAVVLVEDVHWAEDELLDLLDRVLREGRGPLLLLATARPELVGRRPGWGGGRRNVVTIWLEPLTRAETARLIEELLGARLPEEVLAALVERAEGNPFFVEELVGSLAEAGVLERANGAWQVREVPDAFAVPDSVHAVLAARLDRLPAAEKAALQAAAVIGRVFWAGPVRHLLAGVEADYGLLEERDFVRRNASSSLTGEEEYAFKHALTREVAYGSLPKARRGRLHAAFAEWLRETDRARDEHAPLLAYHYSEAVLPEDADLVWEGDRAEHERLRGEAVAWLRRAAELARSRYEMEEAISLLIRAAALAGDDRERALLWRDIGEVHALRYDGDAMRDALLRAIAGPLADAERADAYAFLAFQSSIRSAMWSIKLNSAYIAEWAERALELAEAGSEAYVRALLAQVNIDPGRATDGQVQAVLTAAEERADVTLRSYVLGARSQGAFERRAFHEAAEWADRRLELVPALSDPDHLCEAYECAVPTLVAVERFSEASHFASLHWELARRLSPHHRVHAVSLAAEQADALGDWDALRAETDRIVDLVAANLATPCVRNPRDLLLCAVAHLVHGDEERARELEREGDRVAGSGYESYLAVPRLRLALQRGDRARLEALLELPVERSFVWGPAEHAARLDALAALRVRDSVEREASGLAVAGTLVEPFALRALGVARGDDALLERAQARFHALGLSWHAAQSERLLSWPG